jgi:hypothetical protein
VETGFPIRACANQSAANLKFVSEPAASDEFRNLKDQ